MNITQFLKLAEKSSVISIVDLNEAVDSWGRSTRYAATSPFDTETIDTILSEMEDEGYVFYSGEDELIEFANDNPTLGEIVAD